MRQETTAWGLNQGEERALPEACREGELTAEHIERRLRGYLSRQVAHRNAVPAVPDTDVPVPSPDFGAVAETYRKLVDDLVAVSATGSQIVRTLLSRSASREQAAMELRGVLAAREHDLRQDLANREDHVRQLQSALDASDQSVTEMGNSIAALRIDLQQVVAERDHLRQGQESRDRDIIELRNALQLRDQAMIEMRSAFSVREQEIAQIAAQREVLREALALRDQAIAEARQALASREHDLLRHIATQERLQQTLELREQSIAEMRAALADREQAIGTLQAALTTREPEPPHVAAELAAVRARQTQIAAATEHLHAIVSRELAAERASVGSDPLAARALDIQRRLLDQSGLRAARATLEAHFADPSDPNFAALLAVYDEAETRGLPYWDIRTAVRVLSAAIAPRDYLEVGTRRGWSLAQVFAEVPDVAAYVFELWQPDYGGVAQGDELALRAAMRRVIGDGGEPRLTVVAGSSHDALPVFFAGSGTPGDDPPPQEFDLIAVDGDHSRLGAWWDLLDLMPRVRVGGALVFDDLEYGGDEDAGVHSASEHARPALPHPVHSLEEVWGLVQSRYPNFLFFNTTWLRYRAGIALRLA